MAEYFDKFSVGSFRNVKGNAALPVATDNRTIVLFVSTTGDFEQMEGNAAIAKVYPKAKEAYRMWWRSQKDFKPGSFLATQVLSDTELAHLIGAIELNGDVGFEEKALRESIDKLGRYASKEKRNVHVNKCGTQEEWDVIQKLLAELVVRRGVSVYIYSQE